MGVASILIYIEIQHFECLSSLAPKIKKADNIDIILDGKLYVKFGSKTTTKVHNLQSTPQMRTGNNKGLK